jgi:hypothetical protein
MIRDLRAFYVAILNDEVVCFDTNVAKFHAKFIKLENKCAGYDSFYKYFKAKTHFEITFGDKIYYFQKVV